MALLFQRGRPPREAMAATGAVGGPHTVVVLFGDGLNAPAVGMRGLFAVAHNWRATGVQVTAADGAGAPVALSCTFVVRHALTPPTSYTEVSGGGADRPALASASYAENFTLATWTQTQFVAKELIEVELTALSGGFAFSIVVVFHILQV
jgi:hypothetical protein